MLSKLNKYSKPGLTNHFNLSRSPKLSILIKRVPIPQSYRTSTFLAVSTLSTHHSPLTTHHSSLITHHSSLITHHSSLITHHSSLIINDVSSLETKCKDERSLKSTFRRSHQPISELSTRDGRSLPGTKKEHYPSPDDMRKRFPSLDRIVSERGLEIQRKVTLSDDEILYWFVESAVAGMASTYAASHSSEREFREVYFRRQYSLMLSIKPEWATRKRKEITELLHSQRSERG